MAVKTLEIPKTIFYIYHKILVRDNVRDELEVEPVKAIPTQGLP